MRNSNKGKNNENDKLTIQFLDHQIDKANKEILDIDFFIREGYLILRQDDLEKIDRSKFEDFQQNITQCRKLLRNFFSLPLEEKGLIKSGYGAHPITKCHHAGYREKSSFTNKKGVDFCMEYFHSRNFYGNVSNTFCIPEETTEEVAAKLKSYLPNQSAYEITKFIHENFVFPVLNSFWAKFKLPTAEPTLQIQCTHYPKKSKLGIHQDSAFFEGIIGPATGLIIQPGGRKEELHIDLGLGEALLYTGLQFQDKYKGKVKDVPFPLLHAVEAEAGRMSLPFACFHYT